MVGIGSRDLIIVDTNSTVLIANKNDSKQVLNIVSHLKKMRINEGKNHQIIYKNLGVVIPLLQRVILAIKNNLS